MAGPLLYDMVRETTTTTGTGALTLAGAEVGYRAFAVVGNGNTCFYTARHQSADEWEVGVGTYTASGTTLARTTVLASSNAGAAVNFSAGTKDVILSAPAALLGVTGLTSATPADDDEVAIYDASAAAVRKAAVGDLLSGLARLAGQLGGTAASPDVRGLRETGGPTLLTLGSVADGEFIKRSGTNLIGGTAAPLDGKYITWDSDSVLTNERALTPGDGLAWSYSIPGSTYTLSGRGWNKIGTQAVASSSATIEFTGLTGGTSYVGYCIQFANVAPATDSAQLIIRTSTDNGSTYDSGASDYAWAGLQVNTAGTVSGTADTADNEIEIGSQHGNAANEDCSGLVYLFNPGQSKYLTVHSHMMFTNTNGGNIYRQIYGKRLSAADVNAIQFRFSSGNIASGTFDLYGLAY